MRRDGVLVCAVALLLAAALAMPGVAAADFGREIQPGDAWQSAPPPPPPALEQRRPVPARPAAARPPARVEARPAGGGGAVRHTVGPGETAYRIARRYGVTVDALGRANGLTDPSRIRAGQILSIPAPHTTAAPSVPRPQPAQPPRAIVLLAEPHEEGAPVAVIDGRAPLSLGRREGHWVRATTESGQAGWLRVEDTQRPVRHLPAAGHSQGGPRRDELPEAVLAEARRLIGVPYVWGGAGSTGVDCSGFVQVVFARAVPDLPRTSFELYRQGAHVRTEDLRPGDLVFFTTYASGPSHVGIYLGDGLFIHGSSGARRVLVTPLRDSYYATRYIGARRLLP